MTNRMTYEEALVKVRGYLTSYLPLDDEGEIDEIMQALDQESILNKIKEEIRDHAYCINERTGKEGVYFETVEEIIDKYIERKDIAIKALEQLPSEKCINRESVIEWLKDKDIIKTKNQEENARRELAKLPPITPQPKTGHWICHRDHCENLGIIPSGLGVYEWCSNCDCGIDIREWQRNHYNFCPNCGAKMEVEE